MVVSKDRLYYFLLSLFTSLWLTGPGPSAFSQQMAAPLSPNQVQEQFKSLLDTNTQKALEQAGPCQTPEIQQAIARGDMSKAKECLQNLKKPEGPAAGTAPAPPNPSVENPSKEPSGPSVATSNEATDMSEIERSFASKIDQLQIPPQPISFQQYGYDLFRPTVSTSAATADVTTSADYIVGPGDEFTVTLWSPLQETFKLVVDRNGEVILPKAGAVPVAGLRYSELKSAIQGQLARYYKDFNISVSMDRLRSIRVYVVGEVAKPGSYTLSALSTAYSALFEAGGPTRRGTLRDIQLIRNGKVIARMDLNDFLLKGDRSGDPKLMHEDMILVPSAPIILRQYGYDVFRETISTFAPVTDVPVSADYIVGPGDEFTVTLWGLVEGIYKLVVDRNGEVVLPKAGVVPVAGLRYSDLKSAIHRQLAKYYKDFNLSVSMGRLRSIRIYVVGEVMKPGSYTVSSLSTAYNALFAAGGPTKRGTLRDIQIIRNGKVISRMDLYDFLLKGDKSQDAKLMHEDTILVPLIGPLVGLSGNVMRPAIYEIKDSALLKDAVDLAGGIRPMGFLQRVQVERIVAHEKKIVVDLDLSGGNNPDRLKIPVENMDIIQIFPIADRTQDVVYLKGNVARPGSYQFKKGMHVTDIVKSYQDLLPETYADYAEVIRYILPDYHRAVKPFHLGKALSGDPKENLELESLDEIKIYPEAHFEDLQQVSIQGVVRNPGSYHLYKGMTMSELIHQSGDVTDAAFLERGEIHRRVDSSDPTYSRRIIYFNLGKVLAGDSNENLTLEPQDQVVIYSKEDVRPGPTVSIDGQVRSAGVVPLLKDMRVRDLVYQAGLKNISSLKEAELTRYTVTHASPEKVETQQIPIDLEQALTGDPSQDLVLKEHDHLMVKAIPGLELNRRVAVSGEVRFPGSYLIKSGDHLSDVLARAGGFTNKAFLKGAIFTRESVRRLEEEQLAQFVKVQEQKLVGTAAAVAASGLSQDQGQAEQIELASRREGLKLMATQVVLGRVVVHIAPVEKLKGSPDDILLEDGDTLQIPGPPSAVAVLGSVRSSTAILYESGTGMDYYIEKAGGYTKEADKGETYIIKADGSTVVPGITTLVEAGDAVIVPARLDVKYKPLPFWRDIATIVGQFAIMIAALTVIF